MIFFHWWIILDDRLLFKNTLRGDRKPHLPHKPGDPSSCLRIHGKEEGRRHQKTVIQLSHENHGMSHPHISCIGIKPCTPMYAHQFVRSCAHAYTHPHQKVKTHYFLMREDVNIVLLLMWIFIIFILKIFTHI